MDNQVRKYLFDIKESVDSIENFLGSQRDFNIYLGNKMLRRAVERELEIKRELEIIGEAMSRVGKLSPEVQISSKTQIISMRNRVIHGYDEIVWGTIVRHLPILREEVESLLKQ